jgi:hypothetical protein
MSEGNAYGSCDGHCATRVKEVRTAAVMSTFALVKELKHFCILKFLVSRVFTLLKQDTPSVKHPACKNPLHYSPILINWTDQLINHPYCNRLKQSCSTKLAEHSHCNRLGQVSALPKWPTIPIVTDYGRIALPN